MNYPLLNIQKAMENGPFIDGLQKWSFSIAMLVYQRVSYVHIYYLILCVYINEHSYLCKKYIQGGAP